MGSLLRHFTDDQSCLTIHFFGFSFCLQILEGVEAPSWRRKWQPTPVFLPGESHGWRSLVGYRPRGCKESDTTELLNFHFQRLPLGQGKEDTGGIWA